MGIAVIILAVVVISFFISDLNKDTKKLERSPISEKFKPLINYLNEEAYNGRGTVTRLDKRQYNLYNEEGSNQIIQFFFTLNDLEITWRYKYLQEEAISKGVLKDAYERSDEDQINWAKSFIEKVRKEKAIHQKKMYGISDMPQPHDSEKTSTLEKSIDEEKSMIRTDGVYIWHYRGHNRRGEYAEFSALLVFNENGYVYHDGDLKYIFNPTSSEIKELVKTVEKINEEQERYDDVTKYHLEGNEIQMKFADSDVESDFEDEFRGNVYNDHLNLDMIAHYYDYKAMESKSSVQIRDMTFKFHK